jgi:DNA-binding NarL/FixJ family response regulator
MSGLEVLAIVKREPLPPVVIVLTNHPHERYRSECLRNGADFFFDKSSDFDRVLAAVVSVAPLKS